jgi:hypothetical protein
VPRTIACVVLLAIAVLHSGPSNADAREGPAITGAGTSTCEMFIRASRTDSQAAAEAMFAWVQGWFSARNVGGRLDNVATVGGNVSPFALRTMLSSVCEQYPGLSLWQAADQLYNSLGKAGT